MTTQERTELLRLYTPLQGGVITDVTIKEDPDGNQLPWLTITLPWGEICTLVVHQTSDFSTFPSQHLA